MRVAGKVDVVDACPFEDRGLLLANVRSQEQNPIAGVDSGERGSPAIQLLGDDGGVLVAEVTLLFEQVAHGVAGNP